jgi:hypothetical protein
VLYAKQQEKYVQRTGDKLFTSTGQMLSSPYDRFAVSPEYQEYRSSNMYKRKNKLQQIRFKYL